MTVKAILILSPLILLVGAIGAGLTIAAIVMVFQ